LSAPLRFNKRETAEVSDGAPGRTSEELKVYVQSLAKIVPAEAESLYAIGRSAIPPVTRKSEGEITAGSVDVNGTWYP
jgi:hypothetical protein